LALGEIQGVLPVVVQVVDNVGVIVCAVAGVILVADIFVEACAKEKRSDPGYASGGVLDSLGDVVVGDSGRGKDGHDTNDRKDRNTCVEIRCGRRKTNELLYWPYCHGE
jgi:hypothetical protein